MTSAILGIKAYVQVKIGMRVYYDCPHGSSCDYKSDSFFKSNREKTGIITGFEEVYVGPLDSDGRLPGVYQKTGVIQVRFDGEEESHLLNSNHLILLSEAVSVPSKNLLVPEPLHDLPNPIEFYPGDIIYKADDLLQTPRIVANVKIQDDGTVVYNVCETKEEQAYRKKQDSKKAQEGRAAGYVSFGDMFSFQRTDQCAADELHLISYGNVHHLYTNPSKMKFDSPEEEISFWAQREISETVYSDSPMGRKYRYEYPRELAQELVREGKGDFILASREYENINLVGRSGDHTVRRLRPIFAKHRERVRKLAETLDPIVVL